MAFEFDQNFLLVDNLARFRAETERIDADCARILFDNLSLLSRDNCRVNCPCGEWLPSERQDIDFARCPATWRNREMTSEATVQQAAFPGFPCLPGTLARRCLPDRAPA